MAGYRFYARADAAQDRIWRDTLDTWGETQADSYIRGLHIHLKRLCDNRLLWRRLPQKMAVPADAKNVAEAHEFLNFILKPEVAAKATNYVYFPNGNKASQEFIDKEIIEDPAIYPDEATLQNLFTVLPYDSRTQRQVPAACGAPRTS